MNTTRAPLRRIADFLRGRPARPNAGGAWPDYRAILGNFLAPRGAAVAVDTPAAWERVLAAPNLPESWARRDPIFVSDPFRGLYNGRSSYHACPRPHALSAPLAVPRTKTSRTALAGIAGRAALAEELWRETVERLSRWDNAIASLPVLWGSSAAAKFPRRVRFFAKDFLLGSFNWLAMAPIEVSTAYRSGMDAREIEAASEGMPPPPPSTNDPIHDASDHFFVNLFEGDWHWRFCARLGLSVPGNLDSRWRALGRGDWGHLSGVSFADLPSPFEPALALLNEGFAWAHHRVEFGGSALRNEQAVVLVAPEF